MNIVDYIDRSEQVARAFKASPLAGLTARILSAPDNIEFSHIRIEASRYVYRLGSFDAGLAPANAILKMSTQYDIGLQKFLEAAFEIFFFTECVRESIEVPSYAFIVVKDDRVGIVTQDITEGRYKLSSLLPDEPILQRQLKYRNQVAFQIMALRNVIARINAYASQLYDTEYGESQLRGTSFAVHDGNDLKRIVCADADQLYQSFPSFNHSDMFGLPRIILHLD